MTRTPLRLAMLLVSIQANDAKYDVRYGLVLDAVAYAHALGFPAGFRIDLAEAGWPVAFIELPGGRQVSWHIPQYERGWDGHSTTEKYQRIEEWINTLEEPTP